MSAIIPIRTCKLILLSLLALQDTYREKRDGDISVEGLKALANSQKRKLHCTCTGGFEQLKQGQR